MARRNISFVSHQFYHIYNRGNNCELIFSEDENFLFFLNRFHYYSDPVNVDLLAYCLMPNHYHLLVSPQRSIDFTKIMRAFSISYAKSYNKWHLRAGHVFQGDFKARQIDSDRYLAHVCGYIHLNPVKGGLVTLPEDWKYSDYREWISDIREEIPGIRLRKSLFGSGEIYKNFVMDFADEYRIQKEIEIFLSVSSF